MGLDMYIEKSKIGGILTKELLSYRKFNWLHNFFCCNLSGVKNCLV